MSIMQRVSDITASLHAEARYKFGALLRANNVVEVEMPNHLAILIRRLGQAELRTQSNETRSAGDQDAPA